MQNGTNTGEKTVSLRSIARAHILPIAIGAAAGYAYYYYVGCVTGTCPITSNPLLSTMYGAFMGWLAAPGIRSLLQNRSRRH
jgi:hypothetical protein